MSHARCAPTCALFDLPDVHLLAVEHNSTMTTLTIETAPGSAGCPSCGVVAAAHGRRDHRLHDVPAFGTPLRLLWRKRLWRCLETARVVGAFSEVHQLAAPGTRLTRRAAAWATDAPAHRDTSVSARAHQLGVSWRTARRAIGAEAAARTAAPERLVGVDALGHRATLYWRPARRLRHREQRADHDPGLVGDLSTRHASSCTRAPQIVLEQHALTGNR